MHEHPLHNAIWAKKLVADLKLRGVPVARLLADADIHPRSLNAEDAMLPMDKIATLFELAADYTGDDSFAFHLAQTVEPRDGGLITYVGLSAPTIGDAIVNVARYRRVFSDAIEIDVNALYDDGTVRWHFRLPTSIKRRQHIEWSATVILRFLRMLCGRTLRPVHVGFAYPRNSNVAEYDRFFGCPVNFGAPNNAIRFKLEDLHVPLHTADDRLHKILRKYAEETLGRRKTVKDTLVQQVERLVADRLSKNEADVETIATELGMSGRTLMRRLGDAGTPFRKIVDDLRHALALRYLQDSELSIPEITFLLGYGEVSSFNHAFKRWTGKTPGAFRR